LDPPVPDSLTTSGHSWSNLVDWLPIEYANDVQWRRLDRNAVKSRPFSLCTAASPEHSGETGF
jgi:hypothetical protein